MSRFGSPAARICPYVLLFGALAIHSGCYPKGWPPQVPEYQSDDFPFEIGPYLVRMAADRAAVVLRVDSPKAPKIFYRVGDGPEQEQETIRYDDLWVASLDKLPADQPINYRVKVGGFMSKTSRFFIDRPRGKNLRFVAYGDTRTGHQVHRALVERIAREEVDFFINSGDLVEFGGVDKQWVRFFNIEAPAMANSFLFPSVGNHDNSPRNSFRKYFLCDLWAHGNRYFFHDWGDVRVISLDSEIELRKGSDQYTFLEQTLKEGAAEGRIMILSLHYPPYSSGSHGSNPEMQEVLGELGPKYGVELILSGHDHNYERTKPIGGVTYMVAASGGAPIRQVRPNTFTAAFRTEPHYVIFDLDHGKLVGRAVNLAGEAFDTFVLPPNPPQPEP